MPSLSRDIASLRRAARRQVPGGGVKGGVRRLRFLAGALRQRRSLRPLLDAPADSVLGRLVHARPDVFAFFKAPYLHADWSADERLSALVRHAAALEGIAPLDFDLDKSIELMPLPEIGPDWHVVIDKPWWFHREGLLVYNLFKGNVRLFSLAFSLERDEHGLTALIGGIQGRSLPSVLETYKIVTKAAFGYRIRDLTIDLFRLFAVALGVDRIRAVDDASRHHRSPFFGANTGRDLPMNYDEAWAERDGTREGTFFALPLLPSRRSDQEVPARKRAMYRGRYAMMDGLAGRTADAWRAAKPVARQEAD